MPTLEHFSCFFHLTAKSFHSCIQNLNFTPHKLQPLSQSLSALDFEWRLISFHSPHLQKFQNGSFPAWHLRNRPFSSVRSLYCRMEDREIMIQYIANNHLRRVFYTPSFLFQFSLSNKSVVGVTWLAYNIVITSLFKTHHEVGIKVNF